MTEPYQKGKQTTREELEWAIRECDQQGRRQTPPSAGSDVPECEYAIHMAETLLLRAGNNIISAVNSALAAAETPNREMNPAARKALLVALNTGRQAGTAAARNVVLISDGLIRSERELGNTQEAMGALHTQVIMAASNVFIDTIEAVLRRPADTVQHGPQEWHRLSRGKGAPLSWHLQSQDALKDIREIALPIAMEIATDLAGAADRAAIRPTQTYAQVAQRTTEAVNSHQDS